MGPADLDHIYVSFHIMLHDIPHDVKSSQPQGKQVYGSVTEALQASRAAAQQLPGGQAFDLHCLWDVAALLRRGLGSTARALREAQGVAQGAVEVEAKARLQKGARKLQFLCSFAWHHEEARSQGHRDEIISYIA